MMNQNQLAELFDTSVSNTSMHISNILKEMELDGNSVVKNFFTTAADGKDYQVTFYILRQCKENSSNRRSPDISEERSAV